jgi:hypothetical protein
MRHSTLVLDLDRKVIFFMHIVINSNITSIDFALNQVFLLSWRILELIDEIPLLLDLIPSPKLTVVNTKMSSDSFGQSGDKSEGKEKRFRDQYSILLSTSIPFLRFPWVLDLVSILGDSNATMCNKFLGKLMAIRPQTKKEFSSSLLELFTAREFQTCSS